VGSVGVLTGIGVKVGLAVALALGATAAARYLHLARHGWRPGRGVLRVVETAALGQNRALHLVRVGKRTLFLASTPSRIVMLADVTGEQEEVAREAVEEVSEEAGGPGRKVPRLGRDFAAVLRHFLAPEGGAASAVPRSAEGGPGWRPSGLATRYRSNWNAGEPAGMGMPALQQTARAGDRAERLLAAANMLRGEGARGRVG